MACAAISPQTPQALVVALMLIAGLTRSIQFTALNTPAFADVASSRRSSAAKLSSMLQQVAMLFGGAVAAALLNLSQIARGGSALDLVDFRLAFLAIDAIGFAASFRSWRCRQPRAPRSRVIFRGIEVGGSRGINSACRVCPVPAEMTVEKLFWRPCLSDVCSHGESNV